MFLLCIVSYIFLSQELYISKSRIHVFQMQI